MLLINLIRHLQTCRDRWSTVRLSNYSERVFSHTPHPHLSLSLSLVQLKWLCTPLTSVILTVVERLLGTLSFLFCALIPVSTSSLSCSSGSSSPRSTGSVLMKWSPRAWSAAWGAEVLVSTGRADCAAAAARITLSGCWCPHGPAQCHALPMRMASSPPLVAFAKQLHSSLGTPAPLPTAGQLFMFDSVCVYEYLWMSMRVSVCVAYCNNIILCMFS